jgi:hypothetical protein
MEWALAFANARVSCEKVQFLEVPYNLPFWALGKMEREE